MLKKFFVLTLLVLCCSCESTVPNSYPFETVRLSFDKLLIEVEYSGHIYLVYDGYNSGCIVHAEHCPCKNH